MGDPANLSLGEMKLALQRWRTPQAEVDACLEKDDLIALYKRLLAQQDDNLERMRQRLATGLVSPNIRVALRVHTAMHTDF